jgi:hypothetical protein
MSAVEEVETSADRHARFPPKEDLKATLLDLTRPIAQRMRAIFYLRTLGGDDAVETLCTGASPSFTLSLFSRLSLSFYLLCNGRRWNAWRTLTTRLCMTLVHAPFGPQL